ncbi:hypothetical protein [Bradyrhizobium sp. 143]|uniref:hypothetical protein n=1 Tax=Bradyrhizobium sp. 143 TaxID=2782619 RepID=UPI001FFAF041|nr:hypothetical protein [Bradyrhizobium sp. 143]MCK1713076.1 hypothetical protein [Bradyrhizobium sp. 143]MCK1730498.1 hypothetical protein [Bradyrhizobium sp. 142]
MLETAITSTPAVCYSTEIIVARAADPELGPLMLWMLLVCATMPARVRMPFRAALATQDFNTKQHQSRAIRHNGRIFNSWPPSQQPERAYCCASRLHKFIEIRSADRRAAIA